MSSRTNLRPHTVINAQSMGASITSDITLLQSLTKGSYQVVWSDGSTPIGTIALQVSDNYSVDPSGAVLNAGTWTTATISVAGVPASSAPVSGNTGSGFIDFSTAAYATRIIYTRTSGSGTMSATVTGKVS